MIDKDQRLWELYVVSCSTLGAKPTIRDYVIWLQEEGYNEEANRAIDSGSLDLPV